MIGKNNPLNIRYVKANNWRGQTGHTRGFCDFGSVDSCIRAFAILVLRSYKRLGVVTISQIIKRYAPPSENDTFRYINFVCDHLGCFPFDVIKDVDMMSLFICVVARYESGYILKFNHVLLVLKVLGFGKRSYYE